MQSKKTVLAAAGVGGTPEYYLATLSGGSKSERFSQIHVDADGNIYLCGYIDASSDNAFVTKIDADLNVVWTKEIGGSSYDDRGWDVTTDSSGNVYIVIQSATHTSGQPKLVVMKLNSSGTVQWQNAYGGTGSNGGDGARIVFKTVSDTDYLFIAFFSNNKVGYLRLQASNGTQDFDTLFRDTSNNLQATTGLIVNDSGEGFISGISARNPFSGSNRSALVLRIGSNGSTLNDGGGRLLQMTNLSGYDGAFDIAYDGTNTYTLCLTTLSSQTVTYDPIQVVAMSATTSNTVWKKRLEPSDGDAYIIGGNGRGPSMVQDSNGNLFVAFYVNADVIFLKYNSSGTLLFQQKLNANSSIFGNNLFVDSNDDIYMTGYATDVYILKMPNAGLSNGTYSLSSSPFTSLTVSTYNGTNTNETMNGSAGGISAIDMGSSKSTSSLSVSDYTLTTNVSSLD